jgi:hypothetical protein
VSRDLAPFEPWQQKEELVAADSGHDIAEPDGFPQTVCGPAQQFISNEVTQCVVDPLEVIEVEKNDG